jgi:hypothetical protein
MDTQLTLDLPGHIRSANFLKSERLQKILNYLSDGAKRTSMEISTAACCVAAHSDIAELRHRKNGFKIPREYAGKTPAGRHLNFYYMTDDDRKKWSLFKMGAPVYGNGQNRQRPVAKTI